MRNVRKFWVWTWRNDMQRYFKRYSVEWYGDHSLKEIREAIMESDPELPEGKNQHGARETIVTVDVVPMR